MKKILLTAILCFTFSSYANPGQLITISFSPPTSPRLTPLEALKADPEVFSPTEELVSFGKEVTPRTASTEDEMFAEFMKNIKLKQEQHKRIALQKKRELLNFADGYVICALKETDKSVQKKLLDEALYSIISTFEWIGNKEEFMQIPRANDLIPLLLINKSMWIECLNANQFLAIFDQ